MLDSFSSPARRWLVAAAIVASVPFAARSQSFFQSPQPDLPRAQKHESRVVIDQLEDKWRNAILKSDAAAMQSLLADDYTGITAYGTLQSKDETLSSMRSGSFQLTTLDLSDRKVRFYGSTALVTSSAVVQGKTPDGPVDGDYRYSHVYVRDAQGNWKIVNFEASHVRHPHPH
jgi:ketosteroid isomerase-like protein